MQGFIIGKSGGDEARYGRIDEAEQPLARQPMSADDGAHGIGDGMAGAPDRVGVLQTLAPPLQTDFAHQRLARGREGDARHLGGEGGQRQQIAAD